MAIDPRLIYGPQVDTSDPDGYPLGKARNDTVKGDGTGTPLERRWVNDLWGFFQNVLARAGMSPSGTSERVGASQYTDALATILSSKEHSRVLAVQALRDTSSSPFNRNPIVWNDAIGRGYYPTGFGIRHTVNLLEGTPSGGGVGQDESGEIAGANTPTGAAIQINVGGGGNVGEDQVGYSSNGISGWTSGNFFVSSSNPTSAVYTLDRFLVVAAGFVETSPTGASWNRRVDLTGISGSAHLAVRPSDGLVCAASGNRIATISSDGISQLSSQQISGASWSGVQYDPVNDRFVAIGALGEDLVFYAVAPDGTATALAPTFPAGTDFNGAVSGYGFVIYKNVWVAVARGSAGTHDSHAVIFSGDSGQTWQRLLGVGWSGFSSSSPSCRVSLLGNRVHFTWGTYDAGATYFSCVSAAMD